MLYYTVYSPVTTNYTLSAMQFLMTVVIMLVVYFISQQSWINTVYCVVKLSKIAQIMFCRARLSVSECHNHRGITP